MKINLTNRQSFGHLKCCTREQYLNIRLNLPVEYDDWRTMDTVMASRTKHINISSNNDIFIRDEEKGEKEFRKIGNSKDSLANKFVKAFNILFPEIAKEKEKEKAMRVYSATDDGYGFSAAANWNYPGCYRGCF